MSDETVSVIDLGYAASPEDVAAVIEDAEHGDGEMKDESESDET